MADPEGEYERGHKAGATDERLDDHDRHFAMINGSIGRLVEEMRQMVLAVQRLGDQAVADAKTRITTAAAVEAARKEAAQALESERVVRRERADQSWSPVAKALALLAGLATVVGLVAIFLKP